LKALLVAPLKPLLLAVRVYPVPVLFMLTPLKVATPFEAVSGFLVTDSVPPDGLVPIARVIEALEVVTVLPPASSTVTTGCVVKALDCLPPEGCVVKTSLAAGPTVILKELLVAELRLPLVAVSV
jgi:hypothetical protein